MVNSESLHYLINHTTRFRYSAPVSESVMEIRMQPRSDGAQRCVSFDLQLIPKARPLSYRDFLGNTVHHFDVPGRHAQLIVKTSAIVEVLPQALPSALDPTAWQEVDVLARGDDGFEMLMPSHFAQPTALLSDLARELGITRRGDPLGLLREINAGLHDTFDYAPQTTRVDSPIDDALRARKGVCQDFSHIMIALVRELGIPCRYVSGYLFHRVEARDRSAQDATHAWVEALLPGLGWVGFDPTNNLLAGERHIRTAVGRDYADVPPTRGIFKGEAESELSVAVQVTPFTGPLPEPAAPTFEPLPVIDEIEQSQQQQQQQQ
jgi:transglutaminase-like putative cysteine protease